MARIIRSLSSVIKTSGSTNGLGNEKKAANTFLSSPEQSSCGAVTSEGTDQLAWAGPEVAINPKACWLVNMTLGGAFSKWCFILFHFYL